MGKPGVMADVVLFAFKLRFSEVAKPEKSGRLVSLKLAPRLSEAYDPGPTAAGVCVPVPNSDTRFERVVIVILGAGGALCVCVSVCVCMIVCACKNSIEFWTSQIFKFEIKCEAKIVQM